MKSKQALGKGLGALIPGALETEKSVIKDEQQQKSGIISKFL